MSILSDVSRLVNSVTNAACTAVHAIENVATAADKGSHIMVNYATYHDELSQKKHAYRLSKMDKKMESFIKEEETFFE